MKSHWIQEPPRWLQGTLSGHSKSGNLVCIVELFPVVFVGAIEDRISTDWELEVVNWMADVTVFPSTKVISQCAKLTIKAARQTFSISSAMFVFEGEMERTGH